MITWWTKIHPVVTPMLFGFHLFLAFYMKGEGVVGWTAKGAGD